MQRWTMTSHLDSIEKTMKKLFLTLTAVFGLTVARGQASQNQSWYCHSKPSRFENVSFILIKTDSTNKELVNMDSLLLNNPKSSFDYKKSFYDIVKFDKKTKRIIVNNVTTQFKFYYMRVHIGDDVIIYDLRNNKQTVFHVLRTPDNMIYKLFKNY